MNEIHGVDFEEWNKRNHIQYSTKMKLLLNPMAIQVEAPPDIVYMHKDYFIRKATEMINFYLLNPEE